MAPATPSRTSASPDPPKTPTAPSTTATTTGAGTRAASSTLTSATSPHYTTSLRSRHLLYGTDDRVVLDLGSRVWKVGFSGEGKPRATFRVDEFAGPGVEVVWSLDWRAGGEGADEVVEERVTDGLRKAFFECAGSFGCGWGVLA